MFEIRHDITEYSRGIDDFMEYAIEDMGLKGVHTLICFDRNC
jgi:hypothetical protein